jgi:hypothetical protein
MNKYFTIAASGMTAEQEKSLATAWKIFAWWHNISGFWLLRDHTGEKTAASVRDEIQKIAPQAQVMVVEMQPSTWASSMKSNESSREWLRSFWPPEGG